MKVSLIVVAIMKNVAVGKTRMHLIKYWEYGETEEQTIRTGLFSSIVRDRLQVDR